MIHRAAALAGLLGERDLIAVAGTHGKTTTTAWPSPHCAAPGRTRPGRSARPCPIWAETPASGSSPAAAARTDPAVVEADESDGSFLAFAPRSIVVTNLEPDHLDFHGDAETLTAAFDALVHRLRPGGTLVVCEDDPGAAALGERARARGVAVQGYGTAESTDWSLRAERSGARGAEVEIDGPDGPLTLSLAVTGHHNVLNAVGALAATAAADPVPGPPPASPLAWAPSPAPPAASTWRAPPGE